MFTESLLVAGGSVVGRNHRNAGRNNQDFYCWQKEQDFFVGIVADGCGSHPHSEIGAKIGSRILMEQVTNSLQFYCGQLSMYLDHVGDGYNSFWERVRQNTLAQLRILANSMGGSFSQTVLDYFLFSFVGVIAAGDLVTVFSCGDGIYAINGEVETIDPLEGNMPIYLAYGMMHPDNLSSVLRDQALNIRIQTYRPSSEVESFMIGTDGVEYFQKAADKPFPGKEQVVGPLSQFWTENRYFTNKDRVRRTLFLASNRKQSQHGRLIEGYLADDTTLIVGKHI